MSERLGWPIFLSALATKPTLILNLLANLGDRNAFGTFWSYLGILKYFVEGVASQIRQAWGDNSVVQATIKPAW
ncbi:MAG: hypothetical protein NT011_12765 [Kiritimatiellaeota bacterium]|nr:hypothetical protein [Kiritimatiellota bacterium]